MLGWPGVAQDRLRASSPDTRAGRTAVPYGRNEGGRAAGAAAGERGAAPTSRPGPVWASGPGVVRRAGPTAPPPTLGRNLPRHTRRAVGMAAQAGREHV